MYYLISNDIHILRMRLKNSLVSEVEIICTPVGCGTGLPLSFDKDLLYKVSEIRR